MPNYKEIARLYQMGISRNEICRRVRSSRDTVSGVINVLKAHGYLPGENKEISSEELSSFFGTDRISKSAPDVMYEMPEYKALAKELAKPGVTMHFLWEEYLDTPANWTHLVGLIGTGSAAKSVPLRR